MARVAGWCRGPDRSNRCASRRRPAIVPALTRCHSALALVAVGEGGVAAAEVGVALARRGVASRSVTVIGFDHLQRLPERIGLAEHRHRLAVAQVGVDVHEADLAPEERRRLGPPEELLRSAAVGDRPVHQPSAVGEEQVLRGSGEMVLRLLGW